MNAVRGTAAALLLVVAGVHFQQYVDFMSHVPTVGVLFAYARKSFTSASRNEPVVPPVKGLN